MCRRDSRCACHRTARRSRTPAADPPSRLERLAILHRLVGVCRGIADGRNAPGQERFCRAPRRSSCSDANGFRSSRKTSRSRRRRRCRLQLAAMRTDALMRLPSTRYRCGLRRVALAIPESSRVDRRRPSRSGRRRPREDADRLCARSGARRRPRASIRRRLIRDPASSRAFHDGEPARSVDSGRGGPSGRHHRRDGPRRQQSIDDRAIWSVWRPDGP